MHKLERYLTTSLMVIFHYHATLSPLISPIYYPEALVLPIVPKQMSMNLSSKQSVRIIKQMSL